MEPPHTYLHETSSSVAHHGDYLDHRNDHPLCGVALQDPAPVSTSIRPPAVCPNCEAKLIYYHLEWWRAQAEATAAELDALRVKYRELVQSDGDQSPEVTCAQPSAHVSADSSGENVENSRETDVGPRVVPPAEQDESTPTSLLGQARKEVEELCRRFDEAVPYFRVKNSMDQFSDQLTSDERVTLAQEIGADGSLIRWCTKEIEGLGRRILDGPAHSDPDTMMAAWMEDFHQAPKKTKRWLGRSREPDAS